MSIVASAISKTFDIGSGSVFVIENHTDSDEKIHQVRYVLSDGTSPETKLTAHAEALAENLAAIEAREILK